jgi:hypothetical protein
MELNPKVSLGLRIAAPGHFLPDFITDEEIIFLKTSMFSTAQEKGDCWQ